MNSYSTLRFWLSTACAYYGLVLFAQAIPGTPTQCIAAGLGNSTGTGPAAVVIQWKDNSTTETQWIIRYSTDNGTTFTSLPVVASSTKTTTPTLNYSWTGAITGLTYTFKIQAYDGTYGNMSAPSTPITPRPMSLATYSPPCDSVNLVWQPVTNATSYKLYYREGGTATDLLLATEAAGSTFYQVPGALAKPGLSYQFVIKPYLGTMEIGSSNRLVHIVNSMSSKSGISGAPGEVFAHTFTQASSSTVQSRSLTGVPAGLSFDASTGSLTGTFPALGIYPMHYTVTFATGCSLNQVFTVRVRPATGAPTVVAAIPDWKASPGATRNISLGGVFKDPDADSAVRMTTSVGVIDLLLFDHSTPATVSNFMSYVNAGRYNDVCFHRSVTSSSIETGGYRGAATSTSTQKNFNRVLANPAVANEFGISNVKGTVAMVMKDGNPNSATSLFAINLADNRATLDYANGGSTVFGRITTPTLAVATAINTFKKNTYSLLLDGSSTGTSFPDFPLNNSTVLSAMNQAKLLKITSIAPIPTLSYAVTANTDPAVASATLVAGELQLVSLSRGTTTIIVTATDLDNYSKALSFTISPTETYATWAAAQTFPGGQSGSHQDPDQDGWLNLQEFAFFGDPGASSPTSQLVSYGSTGASPGTRFLTVTFPVRKQAPGISYSVECSMGLGGTWTELWKSADGFAGPRVLQAVDQADRTVLTVQDELAFSDQPRRFLRVAVRTE